jgi:predicted Zn-dependent peptidase
VESRRTFFVENRLKWLSEVDPEAWADDVAWARVLPGHPLGRLEDAAFFERTRLVREAQIQHWIDALTRPDNGTLFIVGGVDPEVAEAEVRSRLASWVGRGKPGAALPKLPPPPPPPTRQVLLFPTPGDTLAMVTLQCQVGPFDPAQPERADVLQKLVQQAAWDALRVRNPLTYTPEATVESWEGGTTVLTVRARVRGPVAPEVAGIELDLVARLHDVQAVAAAAPAIRSELARSWPSRLATTRDMLGQLMITARLGAEWTRITEYTKRLHALPDADLVAALDRCVDHEVVTIVGAPMPSTEAIAGVTPEAFEPGSRAPTSTPSPEKGMLQIQNHGRVPR